MTLDLPKTDPFRLSGFVVDPTAGTLDLDGDVTRLQPKVMELLVCLAEHHGQIVSKEYLLEHVWKGTFVVDGALRRCIYLLRKTLAKSAGEEPILETLHRRGYRLLRAPEPLGAEEQIAPVMRAGYDGDAYRGLQVFEQSHADIFFGRRSAVQQVIGAMDAQVANGHGFCLILGPSGSGKSSLALAGVVPALVARSAGDDDDLVVASYRMSDSPTDPLGHFAARLIETIVGPEAAAEQVTALAQQLGADEDAAVSTILALLDDTDGRPPRRLLLVFDQFEELLIHDAGELVRDQFLAVLYPLVRSGLVWMIATMRSEFYPQFVEIEALRFLRGEHGQIDLTFPGAAEIADIVRKPAALAGLSFGSDDSNRRLDQIIIDEATRQDNSLPLLQFALSELEMKSIDKVLRVADYEELGTLKGCLSGHADRMFESLPSNVRSALPFVLERMVIADPRNAGRVLKRTVPLSDFDPEPGATLLVNAFIEARLITTFYDTTNGAPSAQFAHEAVLANWGRGRDWVQANYAEIRFRSWIGELAMRWDDDGRSRHYLLSNGKPLVEAKRLATGQPALTDNVMAFVKASDRRASIRDVVRGVVTVALALLTVAALFMWRSAVSNREQAQNATQRAEASSDFLLSMFEDADPGVSGRNDLTALDLLDRARDRLSDTSMQTKVVDRAAMLSKLGETYLLVGQYDTADGLFTQAETLLPQIESEHPDVASKVLLELGAIRMSQQSFVASEAYLERALALARTADHHALVAHALNIQGLLAQNQYAPQAAAELFRQAQAALDRADGSAPDVIRLRPSLSGNLGGAYLEMDELELAGEAFDEALLMRREHGLAGTADQTDVLSNLGALRRRQGRNEEAVELFAEASELRTRLHGARHPRNASYFVNKSSAEMQLDRFADARESARRGLAATGPNSAQGDTITALLYANYVAASWLADESADPAQIASAIDQLPVLEAVYGEGRGVVLRTRVASLGLGVDAARATNSNEINSLCQKLTEAGVKLPNKPGDLSAIQVKLATYFESGAACADD